MKKNIRNSLRTKLAESDNIKANEPKAYVKAALELGYADANIKFEDVGTGGASHKGVGDLDVNKVMAAKDFNRPKKKVLYSAVVLDEQSKSKLLTALGYQIPEGWKTFAHHMTIVFGKGLPEEIKSDLGKVVDLRATEIGKSDLVMAVKVDGYPTNNDIPHITLAVNTAAGGKPFRSNKITNWEPLDSYLHLRGTVTEIKS